MTIDVSLTMTRVARRPASAADRTVAGVFWRRESTLQGQRSTACGAGTDYSEGTRL